MLLAACDGPDARPAPPRTEPRTVEAPRPERRPAIPDDFVVRGLGTEPTAVALCVADGASLLVFDVGEERRFLLASSAGTRSLARPRPRTSALRFCSAHGGSYVVASVERREELADTLVFERIDAREARVTGTVESRVGGILASVRRSAVDPFVLVAFTPPEGPVRILRIDADSPVPAAIELRSHDASDGLSREVVGASASESGWVVLHRRGAPEDHRGGVVMVTERGAREIDALHELALLESLTREADQVILVGSFEFDRPHAFRFRTDGRLVETSRIAPGEAPTFVPDRPRADVDAEPTGIELRLRDLGGDVRHRVHIARSAGLTPPALARDGHAFLVATTDRTGEGWGVRILRTAPEVNPR